jgi:hypothetical protein
MIVTGALIERFGLLIIIAPRDGRAGVRAQRIVRRDDRGGRGGYA